MRLIRLLVLYTALGFGANASWADTSIFEALNAAKSGDMAKLTVHKDPKSVPEIAFFDPTGTQRTLAEFQGKAVLVNFWATWCAPCRHEMPSLSQLQTEKGGPAFEVVTISTIRNTPSAVDKFFADVGIENLPKFDDPNGALARSLGIAGLPMSLIIAPDGTEVARFYGDADWASDDAYALVDALIATQP